ncbi:MAG: ABC-type transport auxiliary lipoprotein family protein, partial [Gammaproteobacteria bacterium]
MTRLLGLPSVAAILCVTAACSLWPAQPPAPQVHDFGPLPVSQDNAATPVRLDSVNAPVWLGTDAIHYRLLYDDPTAFRGYADHRWAAPPAELLAARLQNLFSVGSMDKTG